MSTRDDILSTLKQNAHPVPIPEKWTHLREFPSLIQKFTEILELAKGEVIHTHSAEEAVQQVEKLLERFNAQKVAINDEAPLSDFNLPGRFPQYQWHIVDQSEGDLREFCAIADVGITTADAAFAETGSLVLTSGRGKSRFTSLLPPVHIALVPVSCMKSDIFAWEQGMNKKMPGWVGFISGPSKTGDIEGILILGVHGPKKFIVVLYED